MTSYTITFNEGTADEVTITESDSKVTLIKVHAREQDFVKNAEIEFNDTGTDWQKITVGDPVKIEVNGTTIFAGTVTRKRRKFVGAKKIYLQAIGNTAKLWKYKTDRHKVYEDMYTSDIVADLISTYCSGITTNNVPALDGKLIEKIEFDALAVGNAIKQLTKFDNYHFFVDENDDLHYYQPSDTSQFTLNESDILSISWIEENLSNLVNDAIVFGVKVFESETGEDEGDKFIKLDDTNKWLAQAFLAEKQYLNGIKIYADRTTGENPPWILHGLIRHNSLDGDLVSGSDSLAFSADDFPAPPQWSGYKEWDKDAGLLQLTEGDTYYLILHPEYADSSKYFKLYWKRKYGNNVDSWVNNLTSDPGLHIWPYDDGNIWYYSYYDVDWGHTEYQSAYDRIYFDYYDRNRGGGASGAIDDWPTTLDDARWVTDVYLKINVKIIEWSPETYWDKSTNPTKHHFYMEMRKNWDTPYPAFGIQFDMTNESSSQARRRIRAYSNYHEDGYFSNWVDFNYLNETKEIKVALEGQSDGSIYLKLWIDGELKTSDDVTNYSGFGGAVTDLRRYSCFRYGGDSENQGDIYTQTHFKGYIYQIEIGYHYPDKPLYYSENGGTTWKKYQGVLRAKFGWNKDYITATASDSTSQTNYGVQFRRFPPTGYYNFIRTQADAQAFVDAIVEAFKNPLDRATIRIQGNENITLKQKFTLNVPTLDINSELWKVSGYTHEITPKGFYTTLYAGEMPFDLAQYISRIRTEAKA